MEFPVKVALAEAVPTLPVGSGWRYEIKLDGHRMILWRDAESVRLQARSGRDVTPVWMDLALAGMALPAGVVLDGEAVVTDDEGRISFAAAQSRAASTPARARQLAEAHPAAYIVWDVLALGGDVRARPYDERRTLLLDVLRDIGPPIQPVWATDDPKEAMLWYAALRERGVEGLVAKRSGSAYRAGRIWKKLRHSETTDAEVAGFTGSAARPRALAVRLPDGRVAMSQALTAPLAAQVSVHLVPVADSARQARTATGDAYSAVHTDVVVEVLAGSLGRKCCATG
ncbi:DNA ligase [Streptomyces phaeochromogenes]|uniref:ATP-dependent DNA ligase n=1 Tax=Streptomyces phaeochromogenes TaxID=1923 RepID=UPI0033C2D463